MDLLSHIFEDTPSENLIDFKSWIHYKLEKKVQEKVNAQKALANPKKPEKDW